MNTQIVKVTIECAKCKKEKSVVLGQEDFTKKFFKAMNDKGWNNFWNVGWTCPECSKDMKGAGNSK